ncbi:MAG: hypothetical protein GEV07_22025 [Streptosporangiales bacterium]|nr:hypothetical protein [Streptosporangiales bacterium]
MRPRLLVLSRQGAASLSRHAMPELRSLADVRVVAASAAPSPAEAAELLADVDVLAATNVCLPRLDADLLDAAPRLAGVVLYATGYDHLDVSLLRDRCVRLSVLPEYATEAVAEHCLAQVFALATRLHLAHDRSRGVVPPTASLRGIELAGRTLGVVGVGRIGSRLAELARGIGMHVVGCDVDPVTRVERATSGVTMLELAELLPASDVVAVCASAHRTPPPILGARELYLMRPHSLLANIGRPQLVDLPAALAAVRAGRLRGYAVDEVVVDSRTDGDLLDEGRILQTGHSAWWRDEVLSRGARQWTGHILAMLRGSPLDVVTDGEGSCEELTGVVG